MRTKNVAILSFFKVFLYEIENTRLWLLQLLKWLGDFEDGQLMYVTFLQKYILTCLQSSCKKQDSVWIFIQV